MVRFWFIYTTHIIYNAERGLGVYTGCCVGLANGIGGFGPNLTCQTVWHDNFFVRHDIEKNSLLVLSNTPSDEIPHVSDGFYSVMKKNSYFENAPKKMSDSNVRRRFARLRPPNRLPKFFEYDYHLCQTK